MARGHHDQLLARGWREAGPRQSKYEAELDGVRMVVWRGWPTGWYWAIERSGRREKIGGNCATRLTAAKEAARAADARGGA